MCWTMDAMRNRLIVMRHAKAGELPGGPDIERALKARGRRDAAAAGQWLRASGFRPDAVICSSSRRTRQTWQYLSAALGESASFVADERLYSADADGVIAIIGETDEAVHTLLYVGHNPAAAEVVAMLTGAELPFPTSAIAVIDVEVGWADIRAGAGALVASWTPTPQPALSS
jgi:phosphohistidine phosphatase